MDFGKLVLSPEPIKVIVEELYDIILENKSAFQKMESKITKFEKVIEEIYTELIEEIIPKKPSPEVKRIVGKNVIIMDAMSIREGILLAEEFKEEGYDVKFNFAIISPPTDTRNFRIQIFGRETLPRDWIRIRNPMEAGKLLMEPRIRGIWCEIPDELLETRSIEFREIYPKVKETAMELIGATGWEDITILSDHGYIPRADKYRWPIYNKQARELMKKIFRGDRYISKRRLTEIFGDVEYRIISHIKDYIIEVGDFICAKGRYNWPIPGKGPIGEHGGASLLELIIPIIRVKL